MLEKLKGKEFEYKKLTEAEQKARGILGRLIGPCADFIAPTRNGRSYSEKLWENVFSNPLMQEKIENKCCFGELGHPENRSEIDMEKVAISLAEKPKKGADGKLYGVFDILSTPNGKILKALCDYGCKIGISSRGQGDVDDFDNSVDPDTYECECFDAVLVPGVQAARLKYVTEDFNNNKSKLSLKTVLAESLKTANESERKIMIETLNALNLNEALNENVKEGGLAIWAEPNDQYKDYHVEVKTISKDTNLDEFNKILKENGYEVVAEATEAEFYENDDLDYDPDNEHKYCWLINASMARHWCFKDLESMLDWFKQGNTNDFNNANTNKPINEKLTEAKAETFEIDDLEDINSEENKTEDAKTEKEVDKASEEDIQEPEIDNEQIFLDFLANNFEEEKVRKVCKLLDIEIEGEEETPEDEQAEETPAEEDSNMEETPEEKIDAEKEETSETEEKVEEAIDNGAKSLVNSLKEALKTKSDLESNVKSLQEKLAVSDAKVNEIKEECNRYKEAVARLSLLAKSSKDLKEKNSELEKSLKQKTAVIQTQKERIARLAESSRINTEKTKLTEEVNAKATELKKLNEAITTQQAEYEAKITALNNQLNESKNQTESKINVLTENVAKITNLKESYRKLANKAVNKYIEVKSETLGLTPSDIKRKLGESYTMEDVDQVCEDLKQYQLNVSKLPFSLDRKVGIRVNESKSANALNVNKTAKTLDDDVDESLIKLANFTN